MPELPEVEVTRRGLAPHLVGKTVTEVVARVGALRGSLDCLSNIEGLRLVSLERRAKVLIWVFENDQGARTWLASHMGMSGSWRVYDRPWPEVQKHEHVDLVFGDTVARYRDPRRFGAMTVMDADPRGVPPLSRLGPEPFDEALTESSFSIALKRRIAPSSRCCLMGAPSSAAAISTPTRRCLMHAYIRLSRRTG